MTLAGRALTAITAALAGNLAACGSSAKRASEVQRPATTQAAPATQATSAAKPKPAERLSARQVVAAFRRRGLGVGKSWTMAPQDYGPAPVVGHGVRFIVPSLGKDAGGRAFTGTSADLRALKHYYDALGKTSGLFFSWTFLNARRGVLVQINGDLPRARAMRYRAVVKGL